MASAIKDRLFVVRHIMETIELVAVEVNHNETVEEMIGTGTHGGNDVWITSTNLPNVHGGKTGVENISPFLVKAVSGVYEGARITFNQVLSKLDEDGWIPEDLPALAALNKERCAEELKAMRIGNINAIGINSRWRNEEGQVCTPCLDVSGRCFFRNWIPDIFSSSDYFIVRSKAVS